MTNKKYTISELAEQLTQLSNNYLAQLPAELSALKKLIEDINSEKHYRANLDELLHRLHKLSGSGATFGQPELSARARGLEQRVSAWLANPIDPLTEQAQHDLMADLNLLGAAVCISAKPSGALHRANAITLDQVSNVWLVEDDALLGQELARQLTSFNFAVRVFDQIIDAENAARTEQPDLLIMDVMFEQDDQNATKQLALSPNLKNLPCPLFFISSNDDFHSRVRAAQLGAEGYLLKPLNVPALVTRMMGVFESRHAPPQRVLIVDDDINLSAYYRLVLQGAGLEAEVLSQLETIIEKISAFRPELILMDMHMPEFSGPDLARVIRQYDQWTSLPIVYLSAETDIRLQIDAMNRGADDFLTKPISDVQLIAAVNIRVKRARQLDEQISRDSLTGLLKHASIKQSLDIEVARARRSGRPVTVAMLDIDYFKLVNDNYGHGVGDVVISSVAMLLRQRLRQSDIVGRYGGEEFVVVLPECDVKISYQILDDIRQRFSTVRFSHKGKEFTSAISIGVACSAQYPDSTGAELLVSADEALYAAKRGGRNQVKAAPIEPA